MRTLTVLFYVMLNFVTATAQTWNSLGSGVNSSVETFLIDSNDNLLVGGTFISVNGVPQMGIARWDSVQWSAIGNNPIFSNFGGIYSMTMFQGDLIIGGGFDSINGVSIKNIAKWNGTSWSPLGNGFDNFVMTVEVYDNELYAGGYFTQSGADTIRRFAKWNGVDWQGLASGFGFDFPVFTSVVFDNKLIIGGQFKSIDGVTYASVASWNDTSWSQVGGGFNNAVGRLRVIDDTLYACGTYTQIPQNPCNFISRYDTINNWIQLTYPVGDTDWINDITKYHNQLFVCGNFDNPEDLGIINGNAYDSVGSAFGSIKTLIVYKEQLYVGGDFVSIANLTTRCIAKYDDLSTNIISIGNKRNFKVYPNPIASNQDFEVLLDNNVQSNIEKITILGMTGKSIYEYTNNKSLSTPDISSGVYIIKVILKDNSSISQFLIIK